MLTQEAIGFLLLLGLTTFMAAWLKWMQDTYGVDKSKRRRK